jgi:flagellar motor switch protein FliN/FliY
MSLTAESSVDATMAVEDLARQVVAVVAGADASTIIAGPAGEQQDLAELVPEGGGVATAAEVPGLGLVAIMLASDHAGRLDADHGSWTAAVEPAVSGWARANAASVESLTPPCPASSIGELLPRADGLSVLASGLFDGDTHIGTVVLAINTNGPGATEPPSTAAPAATPTGAPAGAPGPAGATGPATVGPGPLQALAAVEMTVTAELGRTTMPVADLLGLAPGSLIELDRAAGSPIDVLVNGTLIARGEVVVIDEDFGLRITEIIGPDDQTA